MVDNGSAGGGAHVLDNLPNGAEDQIFLRQPFPEREPLRFTPIEVGQRTDMLHRLRPTLRLLQIFGYFPGPLQPGGSRWLALLLRLFWLFYLVINCIILALGLYVTLSYFGLFGLWHLFTISSVINGLKPAINVANFLIFGTLLGRHRAMLSALSRLEADYKTSLGFDTRVMQRNLCLVIAVFSAASLVLVIRIVEFFVANEELGKDRTNDISILLVPVMTIWNVLPICYFVLVVVESLILSWTRALQSALSDRSAQSGQKSARLQFYYHKFLDLTDVQCCVGDVFGPWILATLGWTLFCLCLTIYFATKTPPLESLPKGIIGMLTMEELQQARTTLRFNIVWSVVQVGLAAAAIVVVCLLGTRVNEETRMIMRPLLRYATSEDVPESEKFQVSCFVYKMSTQYVWGATVWRAFPLERSVFFTIGSLIATYAVLLLRFNSAVLGDGSSDDEMISILFLVNENEDIRERKKEVEEVGAREVEEAEMSSRSGTPGSGAGSSSGPGSGSGSGASKSGEDSSDITAPSVPSDRTATAQKPPNAPQEKSPAPATSAKSSKGRKKKETTAGKESCCQPKIWALWAVLYLALHLTLAAFTLGGFLFFLKAQVTKPGLGSGFAPSLLDRQKKGNLSYLRGIPGLTIHPHDPNKNGPLHLHLFKDVDKNKKDNKDLREDVRMAVNFTQTHYFGSGTDAEKFGKVCGCGLDEACWLGFDRGVEPCFLITLNRVYGWSPPINGPGTLDLSCGVQCCEAKGVRCENCSETQKVPLKVYPEAGWKTTDLHFPFLNVLRWKGMVMKDIYTQAIFFVQPNLSAYVREEHRSHIKMTCNLTLDKEGKGHNGTLLVNKFGNKNLPKQPAEINLELISGDDGGPRLLLPLLTLPISLPLLIRLIF